MKRLMTLLLAVSAGLKCYAQAPELQWQRASGGNGNDYAYSLRQTRDSGFIVAGFSNSYDGDITTARGGDDYWVQKTNDTGAIVWQKTYGGGQTDNAKSVRQTTDGGYIIAGFTNSTDGQVTGNHGTYDYWVVKTDDTGGIVWQKCYGGSGWDQANDIQQTTDGGYIVAGYSRSADGQVTGHHGLASFADFWVVKINDTGAIEWQQSFGGADADMATSVIETSDGSFTVAGYTLSHDGDITSYRGQNDYWLLNISAAGALRWQKNYGGINHDNATKVLQTNDGGYVVSGYTASSDGDVTGFHGLSDVWIVKTDDTGALLWQKTFGGSALDQAHAIFQTADSGYVIAGVTNSHDGDVAGIHGTSTMQDYWVAKLSDTGALQWQKCLGGTGVEYGFDIVPTFDSGYAVAGMASSGDGDVTGLHFVNDFWLVKLKDTVSVSLLAQNSNILPLKGIRFLPNPTNDLVKISGISCTPAFMRIYNAFGQIVAFSQNSAYCSLSSLPAGVYIVRAFGAGDELISQGKIIKQ